ncbi:uncharacterized protein LOC110455179 isoform X2 [Mizuhopecten yessoensis]|uniref:uncharacterized protein LOC110455179 isoform X2 n=1 Tax=Mizuhopecten yessoensis TaxID=6573 RepID=UPI000B459D83|nr:uncharacterized protein LOC110455179 isoform X2 [Mizuhopecten yessoensis]
MEDTILQERTQMIDQPKETVVPSARETEDAILQERTDLIAQLKETVGPSGIGNGSPPLNIVFVGAPGCGKSSFINSFAASVADECWREYACSGRRGGGVTHQNTVRIQSVVATNYGTSPSVRDYSLPTLIDLTGFENQDEEITKEVLRLIFYEIPVFGVMTGIDVIDESHTEVFEERKINFMNSLALVGAGHRFLQCVNYCDEVDPTRKRICQTLPHIDVPILKFMNVVCGRHYGVVNSEESYRDVLRLQLRHQIRCWVVNLCKRVATSFTNSTRGPVVPANPPGVDMITILLCVFVCLLFCVVFSIVFL